MIEYTIDGKAFTCVKYTYAPITIPDSPSALPGMFCIEEGPLAGTYFTLSNIRFDEASGDLCYDLTRRLESGEPVMPDDNQSLLEEQSGDIIQHVLTLALDYTESIKEDQEKVSDHEDPPAV